MIYYHIPSDSIPNKEWFFDTKNIITSFGCQSTNDHPENAFDIDEFDLKNNQGNIQISEHINVNYENQLELQLTEQVSVARKYRSLDYRLRTIQLENSFFGEKQRTTEIKLFETTYRKTIDLIADLPFKRGIVEANNNYSLEYILEFPKGKLLMITKPFNPIDMEKDDIIYSYFINDELISANVANLQEFVVGFQEILSI